MYYVIQLNYAGSTTSVREGARAYLAGANPGGGHDRVRVLVRSRGGRWILKWEDIRLLRNFRVKTRLPEKPPHADERIWTLNDLAAAEALAGDLMAAADRISSTAV